MKYVDKLLVQTYDFQPDQNQKKENIKEQVHAIAPIKYFEEQIKFFSKLMEHADSKLMFGIQFYGYVFNENNNKVAVDGKRFLEIINDPANKDLV